MESEGRIEDGQCVPLAATFHTPPANKGLGAVVWALTLWLCYGGGLSVKLQESLTSQRLTLLWGSLILYTPLCEFSPETVGCSRAREWSVLPCCSRAWHILGSQCTVAKWMPESMASCHLRRYIILPSWNWPLILKPKMCFLTHGLFRWPFLKEMAFQVSYWHPWLASIQCSSNTARKDLQLSL